MTTVKIYYSNIFIRSQAKEMATLLESIFFDKVQCDTQWRWNNGDHFVIYIETKRNMLGSVAWASVDDILHHVQELMKINQTVLCIVKNGDGSVLRQKGRKIQV